MIFTDLKPTLRAKHWLITGGFGFLGSHVFKRLLALGVPEAQVVRPSRKLNLADPEFALAAIQTASAPYVVGHQADNARPPDIVIDCAARCGGIGYNQTEGSAMLRANVDIAMNVVDACVASASKRRPITLVQVGSVCSYPGDTPTPFREANLWNGLPEPTNAAYGIAKRVSLAYGERKADEGYLDTRQIVLANLYGPGDEIVENRSHIIPAIVSRIDAAIRKGLPSVTCWGTGKPTRDFLYVDDAADALIAAAIAPTARPDDDGPLYVNAGTGVETPISTVAELIAYQSGYCEPLVWDDNKPDGQMRRCLDCSRIAAWLGWEPRVKLVDGIRRTVAWYRETGHALVRAGVQVRRRTRDLRAT